MELLIGCGNSRERRLAWETEDKKFQQWTELVTLDKQEPADYIYDLECFPYPFPDDYFDEIHAYEVLEHTGVQGNVKFFFKQFHELWRMLKPDGYLAATVPAWNSVWAWGDPSHRRIINGGSLTFLDRDKYKQLGRTPMSDFRKLWKGDFIALMAEEREPEQFIFVLQAIKPARAYD
jgi:SAM-dependent methyltransferase